MTQMNDEQVLNFLRTIFQNMLDPKAPVDQLRKYFADNYHQEADGVHLHIGGLLFHAQTLKDQLLSAEITFER